MFNQVSRKIRIGTSGYSYDDWIGVLYEERESKLKKYSQVFNLVEIDSTFYSTPKPEVVKYWASVTPRGFIFTAKVPKEITHKCKLNPRRGAVREFIKFCKVLEPLKESGKLGCLVIQLPPSFTINELINLSKFLKEVSAEDIRLAVEFRHPSLLTEKAYKVLEKHNAAYVIVDEPLLPSHTVVTSDFCYIRWHGRGKAPWYNYHYSLDELKEWVPKILELVDKVEVIYGLFNNHFYGYAVHNALQMLVLLGVARRNQEYFLRKIDEYFTKRELGVRKPIREVKPILIHALNVRELLGCLMDRARYNRMNEIKKTEVKILELGEKKIVARVKDYSIIIDIADKSILHDCPDWSRVLVVKQLCKHIGRLFLELPESRAREILCDIIQNKDMWKFRPLTRY